MAIKIRYSYRDYGEFTGATRAAELHSRLSLAIPGIGFMVFVIICVFDVDIIISAFCSIIFCVICFIVLKSRYDYDIINGMFLGINGVSNEQRERIVSHFMNGNKTGHGDIPSACELATMLKKIDLEFRNKRITLGEYCEKRHQILSYYRIKDIEGLE